MSFVLCYIRSLDALERKQGKLMTKDLRKAQYRGDLTIGDLVIPCAVLDDGTRVVSELGLTSTLGTSGGKNYRLRDKVEGTGGAGPIPLFLASKALEPFYNEVFDGTDLEPIEYIDGAGKVAKGYSAAILPKVCEIWLKAREAQTLQCRNPDARPRTHRYYCSGRRSHRLPTGKGEGCATANSFQVPN